MWKGKWKWVRLISFTIHSIFIACLPLRNQLSTEKKIPTHQAFGMDTVNNCTRVLLQWEAKVFYICTGQDSQLVFIITEWWVISQEPATVQWVGFMWLTQSCLKLWVGTTQCLGPFRWQCILHDFSLLLAAEGVDLRLRKNSASYSIYGRWEKPYLRCLKKTVNLF